MCLTREQSLQKLISFICQGQARRLGGEGSGGSDEPPTWCRVPPRKDRQPICGASGCHFGVMLVAIV